MNYLNESKRTLSPSFYGQLIPVQPLVDALAMFSEAAEVLDVYKKGLFYGRGLSVPEGTERVVYNAGKLIQHKDILHAVIGVATEAGELIDAYRESLRTGKSVDVVNLCEEVGDVFWYAAIIAREAGVSFEDIQQNNIEKLAKRFPDKFTEFNAQQENRDLAAERKILETVGQVELPNSIKAEVGCISKAGLLDALKALNSCGDNTPDLEESELVEWIFKNFA